MLVCIYICKAGPFFGKLLVVKARLFSKSKGVVGWCQKERREFISIGMGPLKTLQNREKESQGIV